MCSPLHQPDGPLLPGASRRTFLRATALTGAATAATGLASAAPAAARAQQSAGAVAAGWRPDPENPRFTLVVMPDTQYLFDGASIDKAPVEASLRYVLDHGRDENIVFLSHLGDLTESGQAGEFAAIGEAFELLDRRRVGYSVVAGNHDIKSSTDDQRGRTPYLDTFGPKRMRRLPTFGGATPDGYNTYHLFRAAGREWLVLALDWRPSAAGLAWAKDVIAQHPRTPVILTTHELVYANADGDEAELSDHGQHLWDELIAGNDQIFLTLNGHYWPAGRTTRKNTAGNDVHLHITNYQNRYYGGSAMIRLYRFDLARNTIDVETISPWVLGRAGERLNDLERGEIELTGPQDCFAVPIDFEKRFAGFAPVPVRGPRPAERMLIPGTVAYWRFDSPSHRDGSAADAGLRVPDLSGHRNDLVREAVPGSAPDALRWSTSHHPDQPGHGSLYFDGSKPPLRGAYLRTENNAPLNTKTFRSGYTIEAFLRLPADWDAGRNAWGAVLGRRGTLGAAGKTSGDPEEPVATLSVSDGPGLQWAAAPLNQPGAVTNWSHELLRERWWHVAVVNDGKHTTMYIDGCVVARNPATRTTGLATLGLPWLLGAYEYGGRLDQLMHGWLGDIRIVERALRVKDFMIA
ncbi:Tat pathway signal sequence domain protein [Streptomyces sp. NBC_00264]|uniref:LamG-like jellyroll fold domain-containing protein n=1 Tax=unclassified Streptomyces TaxID=2593676 RepID=UPI002258D764|nr:MULTISPECIES: LamG-like jellyroll fold domain-containing protein [unclassified Streptomyces]MCX5161280.1 Tat pathway signal sequence domain protein [Streptomyces sp. NBC_00305]MCX5219803.1 Tat pathway signal sequence domain protein [Streptomyces sp. NBC_00264]